MELVGDDDGAPVDDACVGEGVNIASIGASVGIDCVGANVAKEGRSDGV